MTTEINWGYNCLTSGIHHGRPEVIWNLPLLQCSVFDVNDGLKDIVVARIYGDALQFVEHGDNPRQPQEWAKRVARAADRKFDVVLMDKINELRAYYSSSAWQSEVADVVRWVQSGILSPHYQPLHDHDSLNMLCRILGQSSVYAASEAN